MSLKHNIIRLVSLCLSKCLSKKAAAALDFLGPIRFVQYFLAQRILRINGNTPWPVHWTSVVNKPDRIKGRGDFPALGMQPGCYIQAMNGINVGKNFLHAPNVHIISANHDNHDYDVHLSVRPITIGDNCWVGTGVTILAGVELGDHVVVAAGAVVTKSFGSNQIIGGVPAKHIAPLGEYRGNVDRGFYEGLASAGYSEKGSE